MLNLVTESHIKSIPTFMMDRIDRMEMVKPNERTNNGVSKAEYYIQQLNVNNAKKVALCLVLGFICYHGLIHLRYGNYGNA